MSAKSERALSLILDARRTRKGGRAAIEQRQRVGLVTATLLILFVLPTVYAFVYRKEQCPPPDGADGGAALEESSGDPLAREPA